MSKLYHFNIPTPSAKRLTSDIRFVVRFIGFGCDEKVYAIDPRRLHVVWEGPDELIHREEWTLDANYSTHFHFEFRNVTGTRLEKFEVEPVLITEVDTTCQVLDAPSQENSYP
jgi:hypothetical protein